MTSARAAVAAGLLGVFATAGCQPDGPGPITENFGQFALGSLDATCEGQAGLTGAALLEHRVDHLQGSLSYVTAEGAFVDPTTVTIDVTWPAAPEALCYPAYSTDGGLSAEPRLAIDGLSTRFVTADGKFDETLASKAWLLPVGSSYSAAIFAVTTRPQLSGSWEPFPEYESAGATLLFNVALSGAGPGQASGNVGLSGEVPAELNAAILRSRFAVAVLH